jgi:hypothetical protein
MPLTIHFWRSEPGQAMAYESGRLVCVGDNRQTVVSELVDRIDSRTRFRMWTAPKSDWSRKGDRARARYVDEAVFWRHMDVRVAA